MLTAFQHSLTARLSSKSAVNCSSKAPATPGTCPYTTL